MTSQKPTPHRVLQAILWCSLSASALLTGGSARADSGTWIATTSGTWGDPANWAGGSIADGIDSTANFNTVDITTDVTVSLAQPRTSGTLIFGDTATATPAGWFLTNSGTAANTLTLAVTTGTAAITVNALVAGKEVNISAILAGIMGFIKNGNGTLVLSANNSISGPVVIAGTGSVLRLDSGGILNATSLNLNAPTASGTNQLILNGGSLTVTGTTTVSPSSTSGRLTAVVINSGTANLGAVIMGNSNGGLFNMNGGTLTMASYDGGRAAAAPYDFTRGFVMTGGTATILGTTTVGSANNGSSMSIEGGSLTAQGSVIVAASPESSNTASVLRVTGGRFTSTDTTTGFVLTNKSAVSGTAIFSGGVSTIEKLDMVILASGTGSVLVNGGSLYLGSGGWVKTNSGGTSNITLTSGTIGAKASWSSSLAMSTGTSASNSITIRTADENGIAVSSSNDILLSGSLSGLGAIVKTGSGTLTLSGTNTYSGGTTINRGTILTGPSSGTLGAGNITLSNTAGVVLTLANENAIADSAMISFANSSQINLNAGSGTSETLSGLFDSTTSTLFNTPGTYSFSQLNTQFGGISTFTSANGETITIAAVPEPSTWALLVGSMGMLACFRRCRKK